MHAHGFGDTLMMLRFLPRVRALERVSLLVPRELRRLVQGDISPAGCEYYCPILHLLHFLNISPQDVRSCSYIRPDSRLVERWLLRINSPRKKIGVAWSVGKPSVGDYPREMPLETLVSALRGSDVELHSVQAQGEDEARALGVKTHTYDDFADCAAVMRALIASTLRSILKSVEGQFRPGPYYLPITGGWLPDGAAINWWQEGYNPMYATTCSQCDVRRGRGNIRRWS